MAAIDTTAVLMRRAIACGMAAMALATTVPAWSGDRPSVTIDALLQQEGLGQVRISPDAAWIVIERQAPWSTAATYRFGLMTPHLLSRLEVFAASGALARRIEDPGHATGYVSGPFSPSGEKMIVYRLSAAARDLGILTLATGDVQWLRLTPEFSGLGRTVAWRSETELVLIARRDGDLPLVYRLGWQAPERRAALWDAFASGHAPSMVATASGQARRGEARAPVARLVLFDLTSEIETVLANADVFDLELSPDGRTVAALLDAETLQAKPEALVTIGTASRRRRLLLVDIDKKRAFEPLPDRDFLSHLISWSPDSRRVIAFSRAAGGRWSDGEYWLVERRGAAAAVRLGESRPWLDEEVGKIPIARAAWSQGRPVLQVRTPSGERAWVQAGSRPSARQDVRPGERLIALEGGLWRERPGALQALGDPRRLIAGALWSRERALDGGSREVWNPDPVVVGRESLVDAGGCLRAPLASRAATCLSPLAAEETLVAVSPRLDFFIGQIRSAGGAMTLRLHRAQGTRALVTINAGFDALAWGAITPIAHRGPNGEALTSWLLSPASAPGDRPPPVAVVLYPGARYGAPPRWLGPGGDRLHINPAVLAASGYAVLVPSLPDPAGAGPPLKDLGGRIAAIVDRAADLGLVDRKRVALIGHSYGGYGALLAASQSDRFAAVVASAGYTDLSRVYALPPHFLLSPEDGAPINALAGWAETGQGAIGASLIDRPQDYVANSPIYVAGRIRTPTLLIEGDLDPAGGDVLFGALYRMDGDAALVTYVGEGHVLTSPANLRDLHARILDWLDRHLSAADLADPTGPALGPDLEDRAHQ